MRSNVCLDELAHALGRLVRHETEVEGRIRLGRDGVGSRLADATYTDAAHVEGREHDALGQQRTRTLAAAESERAAQRRIVWRQGGDGSALRLGDRTHVVVVSGDRYAALVVAHAGDEARDHRSGIRCPVAI